MMGPERGGGSGDPEPTWKFTRYFVSLVNELDITHATTVGIADGPKHLPRVADVVRVLSFHSYRPEPKTFRGIIRDCKAIAEAHGKAVFLSEAGHYGTGQTYPVAMPVIRSEDLGWYVWELMVGKSPFVGVSGIFYANGKVRSYADYCALLGIEQQLPFEQVHPVHRYSDAELASRMTEALSTDTRPWNLERRLALLQSVSLSEAIAKKRMLESGEELTAQRFLDMLLGFGSEVKATYEAAKARYEANDAIGAFTLIDAFLEQVQAELAG